MAVTTTTVTPGGTMHPFSGLSEPERNRSPLPLMAVRFSTLSSSITAGGVGNEQELAVKCVLPVNYAGVFMDLGMRVFPAGGGANNFDTIGTAFFTDSDAGTPGRKISYFSELVSTGNAEPSGTQIKCYRVQNPPTLTFVAPSNDSAVLQINLGNQTQNDGEYTLQFFASFLLFSVNQANHVAVNSPQLVRPC